jgi:hypothetical protein
VIVHHLFRKKAINNTYFSNEYKSFVNIAGEYFKTMSFKGKASFTETYGELYGPGEQAHKVIIDPVLQIACYEIPVN